MRCYANLALGYPLFLQKSCNAIERFRDQNQWEMLGSLESAKRWDSIFYNTEWLDNKYSVFARHINHPVIPV